MVQKSNLTSKTANPTRIGEKWNQKNQQNLSKKMGFHRIGDQSQIFQRKIKKKYPHG